MVARGDGKLYKEVDGVEFFKKVDQVWIRPIHGSIGIIIFKDTLSRSEVGYSHKLGEETKYYLVETKDDNF